ncbi:MAG TPA: tRNA (adenosine(37)-N6)-threonylcarbamoyltransferase complex transferase subunit TsaD [Chthoniobacterales bacterium]|jgi:N6-L-threonylcarbamoyladenine synthase|nr:tRNA (adenosine(37)-N6)-threonylcarbamoyltransferase complex transferase subunit TsaD [Chthoniobacterales bacterium]
MDSLILAVETSCDETAVAILRGSQLLASEVSSQVAAHQPYGGVVPELASRHHLQYAPGLVTRAIAGSGVSLSEVDAFAATSGPGLASSLMIGASLAKGFALGFRKPYLAINHLEGHLLSPFFGSEDRIEPNVSLIVSGGHTLLVEVEALARYRVLGRTVDDAAGEAFDKVAKMIGLGYPGGPEIERLARDGDPTRFDLPRSMLHSGDANFSFSGLKTAVRYLLPKIDLVADSPDLCSSFQRAVTEVLVAKTLAAARQSKRNLVTVSGGVSRNQDLRNQMAAACQGAGVRVLFAPPDLCTDNAAMIAFAAQLHLARGDSSPLTTEIDPNLALA